MGGRNQDGSYVQCLYCGEIYQTKEMIPSEEFIVKTKCPHCGVKKGLNCGENREDIYLYANINILPRYYEY